MADPVLDPVVVEYPSSDGEPLAESDFQFTPLTYVRNALRHYYRGRRDVYVSGNLLLYYEEGNLRATVAPDVFVVIGAPNHDRSSYLLWQEPKAPDWVLEVTSHSTELKDRREKRELYRELGVAEYWRYDPTGDYLEPRLHGERLSRGQYVMMPPRKLAGGALALRSRALAGVELRLERGGLRLRDVATGRDVLPLREANEAWQREQRERQRAERKWQQAERKWQQAEKKRVDAERASHTAQARIAELEAALRRQNR